jgi:hypothetical protein
MTSRREKHSGGLQDGLLLVVSSLAACGVIVGAFVFTEEYHLNPMWVFLPGISLGFFAQVGWGYRREFRSVRFSLFFFCWLLINVFVFLFVVATLGWLYWIPTLVVEVLLFYLTAYWLFGLLPPLRPRKKDPPKEIGDRRD